MCVFYECNMMSYNNAFILQGSSPPTFEIPTFTVTINPLESDEMTFVPGSPPAVSGENQPLLSSGQNNSTSGNNQTGNSNKFSAGNGNSMMSNRSIANMTVIVDDEVTTNNGNNTTNNGNNPTTQLLLLNNGQVHLSVRKEMICSNFFNVFLPFYIFFSFLHV